MADRFQTDAPAAEQANPYVPKGPPDPLVFEMFMGMDTATTRPGVDEKQMAWCDGFIPLSHHNLRTLYGVGTRLYNTTTKTISFFDFANIGPTPYSIIIHTDGSIFAVNTNTRVATQIAAPGTIQNSSRTSVGLTQSGSTYVIIVCQQDNGYFVWDGTLLFQAGTLSPEVTITNNGTGYVSAPTASASGGSGSGATFSVTVLGGLVTDIALTNPGSGYLAGETVTIGFTGGGGSGAAATVTLMPFGVAGTSVETYVGRVWVSNGPEVSFTAPGSVTNFSTAAGGGNFTSADSFLRVGYVQLKQTNGFLYLIADSSINYISGVTTSGSPPTTTFTNQNADPEVGTPWPSTVTVYGRNIILANAFGAHISYGAAVTKISEPLDGVYNTVPNFGSFIPSSAKAIIFGKKVWMLLLPIIDPISGQQVNKLFMWNGKGWWASEQDVPLNYIQSQEINSVLTAYGTDGTSLYPMFQQPSTGFTKIVQSKLWAAPGGYMFTKSASRIWGATQYYSLNSAALEISIDNENSQATDTFNLGPPTMNWVTATGAPMNWTTQTGAAMVWTASGISILAPTSIAQVGVLIGMTVETLAADMALISLSIHDEIVQYRG